MSVIKVKRGLDANLPTTGINVGELFFTTDTKRLLVGDSTTTMKELANLANVLTKADNLNSLASKPSARTNLDVYSKSEVDAMITGMDWCQVVVASTGNLTLSGEQTIDGIAVVAGNRVLIKNQTDATENGIYVAASGSWSRATDADSGVELQTAAIVVESGTSNGDTAWLCTTNSITLGTTEIEFIEFPTGNITAGAGLKKTGNQIYIDFDNLAEKDDPFNINQNDAILVWDGNYDELVQVDLSDLLGHIYTLANKVKYDSGDGTAGYLSEKIVAGTGIAVSEDSNKVSIAWDISDFAGAAADVDAVNDIVIFKDASDGVVKQVNVNNLIAYATIDGGSF